MGQPAAVYYISPTQLNVQSPDDGATGPVLVQVANQHSTATATANLQISKYGRPTDQCSLTTRLKASKAQSNR
jgi:uncharacterized protein (TIGR03437 family)